MLDRPKTFWQSKNTWQSKECLTDQRYSDSLRILDSPKNAWQTKEFLTVKEYLKSKDFLTVQRMLGSPKTSGQSKECLTIQKLLDTPKNAWQTKDFLTDQEQLTVQRMFDCPTTSWQPKERLTVQRLTNVRFLRTAKKRLSHSFHAFFWHTRPSCTFSFTKAPRCLKLLIPASNAIGRWGITVELSPECPLNRNNWFVLHKLQHTKRLLLRSRHYRFVTSQTEREKRGVGLRLRTKLEHLLFHSMWENLLLRAFL